MTSETKVIGVIGLATAVILIGGIILFSSSGNTNVTEDQILTRQGLHWHPKLTVTIKGVSQELPADLGLGAVHSNIHTHAADSKQGIIHLEKEGITTKDDTKLGRFFKLWGKEFNANKLFDQTNGEGGTIKMTVNGQENTDFENYLMKDGDEILVRFESRS